MRCKQGNVYPEFRLLLESRYIIVESSLHTTMYSEILLLLTSQLIPIQNNKRSLDSYLCSSAKNPSSYTNNHFPVITSNIQFHFQSGLISWD